MATGNRLIEVETVIEKIRKANCADCYNCNDVLCRACLVDDVISLLDDSPKVDAVELPKGKAGDYLVWDNGTGFEQVYHIHSIMVCEDCMRYELEKFCPVVNHPNIVGIMNLEQAEERWHKLFETTISKEEPTLTACVAKMDGGKDNEID